MQNLDRITFDPHLMGGKPCIRGLRVTVGTVVGLLASGHSFERVLTAYPYLEENDIRQALGYAAQLSNTSRIESDHRLRAGCCFVD